MQCLFPLSDNDAKGGAEGGVLRGRYLVKVH